MQESFFHKESLSLERFVIPGYFRPFRKDTVCTLRAYLTYEGENSPYELSEVSSEVVLGACEAYLDAEASDYGSYNYREDFSSTPVLKVDLKRNSLFTEHTLSQEEKEALSSLTGIDMETLFEVKKNGTC